MNQGILLLVLLGAAAVWLIMAHKRLVRAQDALYETWGALEDILERRHHPAVGVARRAQGRLGVAADAGARVERLSERSREAYGPLDVAAAEAALDAELAGLLHAAALGGDGADHEAAELVARLGTLAVRAGEAAEVYNKAARDMNVLVESFPAGIAARLFGYRRAPYYEPRRG